MISHSFSHPSFPRHDRGSFVRRNALVSVQLYLPLHAPSDLRRRNCRGRVREWHAWGWHGVQPASQYEQASGKQLRRMGAEYQLLVPLTVHHSMPCLRRRCVGPTLSTPSITLTCQPSHTYPFHHIIAHPRALPELPRHSYRQHQTSSSCHRSVHHPPRIALLLLRGTLPKSLNDPLRDRSTSSDLLFRHQQRPSVLQRSLL